MNVNYAQIQNNYSCVYETMRMVQVVEVSNRGISSSITVVLVQMYGGEDEDLSSNTIRDPVKSAEPVIPVITAPP